MTITSTFYPNLPCAQPMTFAEKRVWLLGTVVLIIVVGIINGGHHGAPALPTYPIF